MTTRMKLVGAGAGGRQMRENRIPAFLSAGCVFAAFADPAIDAAREYVQRFRDPVFLAELRGRGYPVSDEAAAEVATARVYETVDELLEAECGIHADVQGLVSAVPVNAHDHVAIRAMQAGLDVSSDKPTAKDLGRAMEMLEVAERGGRVLQIGYQGPVQVRPVLKELRDGAIGTPTGGETAWTRQDGIPDAPHFWEDPDSGGVMRDIGSHEVAKIISLVGAAPVEVQARGSRDRGLARHGERFRADDTIEARLRFEDGQLWYAFVSWSTGMPPNERARMTVFGDREDARIEQPVIVQKSATYRADRSAFDGVVYPGGGQRPRWLTGGLTYVDAMIAQAGEFVDARREGTPLALPASHAVAVEAVADAVLRSAGPLDGTWGSWVTVPA